MISNENCKYSGHLKDNIIAVIGKIIKFQRNHLIKTGKFEYFTLFWLKNLPIRFDSIECPIQHAFIFDLLDIEPNLTTKIDFLQEIIRIFVEIIIVDDSFNTKIASFVNSFQDKSVIISLIKDYPLIYQQKINEKISVYLN